MLISKLLAVAVLVFPATSLATPSATERMSFPAVPPAPVLFATLNTADVIADVVSAEVVISQPVDAAAFVISLINIPLTASLKVIVI